MPAIYSKMINSNIDMYTPNNLKTENIQNNYLPILLSFQHGIIIKTHVSVF